MKRTIMRLNDTKKHVFDYAKIKRRFGCLSAPIAGSAEKCTYHRYDTASIAVEF